MTEYDYSPAAYERYIAQQTRVSNWVTDTLQQSHAYRDPFVLSPTLRDRAFYDEPDRRTTTTRLAPTRPQLLDERSAGSSSRPSRDRTRSYSEHRQRDHDRELRPSPTKHRSHSHSRSSSTQKSAQIIYQPSPPRASQPYTYPQPHTTSRTPAARMHTAPPGYAIYQYPTGNGHNASRAAHAPPPPPGQIYPTYPERQPYATSREQLHRGSSQIRHHSSKPPPQPYYVVPGGGPRAEYKRGVRLGSTHVLVSC
ncbi:hypothetical protein PAXINDRAFT_8765 [Paxillus involutus ATCC 200175]|nr:hypothetical protein PAXINDRAFT_8765 [Paxillus involutus ATCC 200175]